MLSYKRVRLLYQVAFFGLFCFLIYAGAHSWGTRFELDLFSNMSGLSAIANILSQHNIPPGLMLAVAIAVMSLFFGRFFCGWICPMGIVQHFGAWIFRSSEKAERYSRNTYRKSHRIKYIILIIFLFCACFGVILSGWVDPLSIITRFSVSVVRPVLNLFTNGRCSSEIAYNVTVITSLIFVIVFLLNIYMPRFWCRTVCPLGALLSLFSVRPLFRIERDREKCIKCGLCRQNCQGGCEPDKNIINSECLMCMNCLEICPVGAIRLGYPNNIKDEISSIESYAEKRYDVKAEKKSKIAGVKLSRRDFIVSGIVAVFSVGLLRNVRAIVGRGFEKRIRPPGSLPEEDFLARCVRCGECLNVCPTNVLQPALTETNIEGLWTPVLNMQYGYCEYDCVRCTQVCPTGAIRFLDAEQKHKEKLDKIGTAFVDRGRCLPWAFGRECLVCQEVCPISPKAIYFQYRKFVPEGQMRMWIKVPYVDAERCIGCGACEYNCPVQDKPAIYVTSIGEQRSVDRKLLLSDIND